MDSVLSSDVLFSAVAVSEFMMIFSGRGNETMSFPYSGSIVNRVVIFHAYPALPSSGFFWRTHSLFIDKRMLWTLMWVAVMWIVVFLQIKTIAPYQWSPADMLVSGPSIAYYFSGKNLCAWRG